MSDQVHSNPDARHPILAEQLAGKPELLTKLLDARRKLASIRKTGENEYHDYSYMEEKELLSAINPVFNDVGLVLMASSSNVRQHGDVTALAVELTIADPDTGQAVTLSHPGYGKDKQDKGPYKALTGGMKYALQKALGIPVRDADEPEGDRLTDDDARVSQLQADARSEGEAKGRKEALYQAVKGTMMDLSEVDQDAFDEMRATLNEQWPSADADEAFSLFADVHGTLIRVLHAQNSDEPDFDTDAARRKLMVLLNEAGINDDDDRHEFYARHDLPASSRDFNPEDWETAIEAAQDEVHGEFVAGLDRESAEDKAAVDESVAAA